MYLLREDFNVSYPLIGQKLGGKDHTTVIHSYLKIKRDLENDPQLLQELLARYKITSVDKIVDNYIDLLDDYDVL